MRYFLLLTAGTLVLSGCSLFQRSPEMNPSMISPGMAMGVPPESDQEAGVTDEDSGRQMEGEVAKLNTKVEALETKLEVLTLAFEKYRAKKEQPEIRAESSAWDTSAQPNLAAPVNEAPETVQPVKQVSAAPVPPSRGSASIELGFRKAMTEFQQGRYREAAQQFASVAHMDENHLLAGHALYWAGEAYARIQQWSSAMENWHSIELNYPTSTYVPEALAGLAKAYEVQGNVSKAQSYREMLSRAFPNSPVTLASATSSSPAPEEKQEEAVTEEDGE